MMKKTIIKCMANDPNSINQMFYYCYLLEAIECVRKSPFVKLEPCKDPEGRNRPSWYSFLHDATLTIKKTMNYGDIYVSLYSNKRTDELEKIILREVREHHSHQPLSSKVSCGNRLGSESGDNHVYYGWNGPDGSYVSTIFG